MKVLKTFALALAVGLVMSAGPVRAQAAPPVLPPAQPPVQPPVQPPAKPPTASPGAQKPADAPPKPRPPFIEGAKIALVNFDYVAATSNEGKAMIAKIQDMQKQKTAELAEKSKKLEDARKKAGDQASIMNDQARAQAEREIQRLERDLQSAQQDASTDFNEFSQRLQNEFGQKVLPMLQTIATEKGLHMVLRAVPEVLAWANEGVDLSDELVKRLNASSTPPKK